MNKRNPFSILNEGSIDAVREREAQEWESRLVLFTMTRAGLGDRKRDFVREHRDRTSQPFVSFRAFNEEFSTFPVWLGGDKLQGIPPLHQYNKAVFPVWLKTFLRLPFIPAYEELHASLGKLANVKPVALVFPRKGFRQGLVVHNGDFHTFVPPQSSCHVYHGGGRKPVDLIVQPYAGFVDHIYRRGHGWKLD